MTIRAAAPGDRAALAALRRYPTGTQPTAVALEGSHVIGAATCVRVREDDHTAEVSLLVADEHRHRGIGTLLIERLAAQVCERGITRLVGTRPLSHGPDCDVRRLVTEQSPLRRMLAPLAVAVVGAGREHGGTGHEALRALRDFGFPGRLFAVNPSGRPVCGIPAYRTVAGLPGRVDLLAIAVPDDEVAGVLADAGRRGIRAAALLGTGPRSGDAAGDRHRADIRRAAREFGIRLVGPASLGVLNADPEVRLNASLAPFRPPSGGLSLAVRSGAVGVALLADAVRDHCGVSTLVALGDGLDVALPDLLAYWFDDPATRVVALSPEPFGHAGGLLRAARALARRKPVLAIGGADDVLAPDGVIRTASIGETLDAARMLVDQPLPAGRRLAVVGNAGGLTAIAAGAARLHGFDVVPLSGSTRACLPYIAGSGRCDNPVDLGVDAAAARLAEAAETVASSGEADILVLVLVGTRANVLAAQLSALAGVLDDHPGLTAAAVVTGETSETPAIGRRRAPVFREPEQAVRALAHARDYASWRRDPLDLRPSPDGVRSATVWPSGGPITATPPRADPRPAARVQRSPFSGATGPVRSACTGQA